MAESNINGKIVTITADDENIIVSGSGAKALHKILAEVATPAACLTDVKDNSFKFNLDIMLEDANNALDQKDLKEPIDVALKIMFHAYNSVNPTLDGEKNLEKIDISQLVRGSVSRNSPLPTSMDSSLMVDVAGQMVNLSRDGDTIYVSGSGAEALHEVLAEAATPAACLTEVKDNKFQFNADKMLRDSLDSDDDNVYGTTNEIIMMARSTQRYTNFMDKVLKPIDNSGQNSAKR